MKAGFVAVLGLPNAGKSSLINALVGEKVSIVSPKPQTTRRRVLGVVHRPQAQIVFVDSPGFLSDARSKVHEFLKEEYEDVAAQADVLMVVVSPDLPPEPQKALIEQAKKTEKALVVVWNKSDVRGPPENLEGAIAVSALGSEGAIQESILNTLIPLLPEAPAPLFSEDLYTTQSLREMAGEVIREKIFLHVHQEVPFGTAVQIRRFDESEKLCRIYADILVGRDSHKGILIGKSGAMLKTIGTEARKDLEKLLGTKVFLELHISVKPNWESDRRLMKELGYVVE